MGGDGERGREGLDSICAGELGRLRKIVAEATGATFALLGRVLVSDRDLTKPLLVILGKRDETDPVMLRQLLRLGLPFLELLARVDVRIREKHRHLVSVADETRHAGGRTRSAAGMEQRRHFTPYLSAK